LTKYTGIFQDFTLLCDALEFGLQAPHFVGLHIYSIAYVFGHTIPLRPGLKAVDAYSKPFRHLAGWVAELHHLLDCSDPKFLRVPLPAHTISTPD